MKDNGAEALKRVIESHHGGTATFARSVRVLPKAKKGDWDDAHGFHHVTQMPVPANHVQDDKTRHVAMLENGFDIPACVEVDIGPVRGGEEHRFGAKARGRSP